MRLFLAAFVDKADVADVFVPAVTLHMVHAADEAVVPIMTDLIAVVHLVHVAVIFAVAAAVFVASVEIVFIAPVASTTAIVAVLCAVNLLVV